MVSANELLLLSDWLWLSALSRPQIANVSRETILPQATNKGFVVLVALIVGWRIPPKCRFSAQPIGVRAFEFELSDFR